MALGFCMSCETLRSIRPVSLKLGSRECEWRPISHDVLRHEGCAHVVDADDTDDGYELVCRRCGVVTEDDCYVEPCDGDKRDIR